LVKQFIFESMLISLAAFVIAIIIVQVAQSSFNQVIGGNLSLLKVLSGIDSKTIITGALVLVTAVILSGFYPAFVLSSYQPVTVLKGKFQRSSKGQFMRKALVIFQFTASAALITGTLIVSRQLKYMNEADLGMNIQNIMIVRAPVLTSWDSTFIERVENYKHELKQISGIISAATSSRLPGDRLGRGFGFRLSDQPSSSHYTMSFLGADYDFFDTYGVSIISGRRFLPTDHKADFNEINTAIINQNALTLLGINNEQEAIGKEIIDDDRRWRIIGVVNDFHQESLKKPMEPIVFLPTYSTYGPTSIRFRQADSQPLISEVEKVYKKFFPDNAFSYVFLEDSYKSQYNDEKRFAKVILIFTGLGIIISCLGLIGLSSYTAVQRTREIGIRKALGASLTSIVALLSTGFMKLVLVSIILALPIAYYFMNNWLMNYPYRISLQWFLFIVPAMVILLIASATISFQIVKTARTNPANTLKYE
jgi:putative ABC transport system permease protein